MKKTISVLTAVLLVLSLLAVSVFAAPAADTKAAMVKWLQNNENTEFDYTDTSYVDNLIDWTAFTLARDFAEVPAEYEAYINEAVANSYDSLFPSDISRIVLGTTACGLDAADIGGKDLLAALAAVDYASQIYLSSLAFPLIAMNFKADFSFDEATKETIVNTILAAQQPDGGWSYCSQDLYGYGIYTDPDDTAMAIQALAPYYETNDEVKAAVDSALAYLKASIGGTGAVLSYGSPSGESTAQVVLALCALGMDPLSAEYTVEGKTLLDGLLSFVTENGGALNYKSVEDPLTTYQVLQGLEAIERFQNGKVSVFTYDEAPEVPVDPEQPTEPTTEKTDKTEAVPETVEIPKTGGETVVGSAAVFMLGAAAVLFARKKDA